MAQRSSLLPKGSLMLKNPLLVPNSQRIPDKLNSIDQVANRGILKTRFISSTYRQPVIFESTQRRSLESSDHLERKFSLNSNNAAALSSGTTSRIINMRNAEEDGVVRYAKKTKPKFQNEFRNTLKEAGATAYHNRRDVYNLEEKYGGNNIFKNYNWNLRDK